MHIGPRVFAPPEALPRGRPPAVVACLAGGSYDWRYLHVQLDPTAPDDWRADRAMLRETFHRDWSATRTRAR